MSDTPSEYAKPLQHPDGASAPDEVSAPDTGRGAPPEPTAGPPDAPAAERRRSPADRWRPPGVRAWSILVLFAAVAGLVPCAWLNATTLDQRAGAAEARHRPVAIVLGAGLRGDGTPTTLLARRLDIAARLYRTERVEAVLVSGDNSVASYNEPDAMRDYLAAAGVPRRKVAADYAGFSTWETCTRARRIFGVEAASVVTQNFHLPRAVALCSGAGIDAQGVGDSSYTARTTATVYGYVREVPAAFPAVYQALLRPDPQFLGPVEPDVREALAARR
ncbi:SanA/YdcF family protein [Streptomonospora wellingtoniae]|uniref:ElyC/SanA/YdcF family protein n=1 Tax=Streptomonospora wellingtoniae TaxID=3075544 RepID=A0ABU2KT33_9ACTN|nr:ElyC/SanA/YdcF family protein [Streptomonospora sp. DSM 45055]MDT0302439.1 ElyC/SanA/YdcF family protein [Streptomonospora sp. DSM 45055]